MTDDDDAPTCDVCERPATPGGLPGEPDIDTICPNCEDAHQAAQERRHPPIGGPTRTPPHGNTTR